MVTASALIGEVIPLRDRGRYQGALGAVFGVTTVVGPAARRLLHRSPRLALGVLAQHPGRPGGARGRRRHDPGADVRPARPVIDYAGIVWVGIGASGLTLATSLGGGELAWTSPTIIGLVVGSILALAMFVRVETRAAEPILPMRLFRNPVFTVCCVLSFIVGFAMLGALTFMPTFMQFVDGVSAIGVGIADAADGGRPADHIDRQRQIVGRTGRYKMFPVAGTAMMVVGFVLLSRMNAATPIPAAVAVPVRSWAPVSACACRCSS